MRKRFGLVLIVAVIGAAATLAHFCPRRIYGVVRDELTQDPVFASVETGQSAVQVDAEGRYDAGWVWGNAILSFRAEGYHPIETQAPRGQVPGAAVAVDILMAPRILAGTIRDEETALALSGALVTGAGHNVHSDEDGAFVIYRVPTSSSFEVLMPGYETARLIASEEGAQEVVLRPVVTTVSVLDAYSQRPVMGAIVAWAAEQVATTSDGTSLLRRLADGVTVTITAPGYAPSTAVFEGSEGMSVMLRPDTLGGVVLDAGDLRPVAGARVVVSSEGEPVTEVVTDAEGRYSLAGLPDRINLAISAPGYDPEKLRPGPVTEIEHHLRRFQVRGLYMPLGILTSEERIGELISLLERTECNALVVDLKNDRGWLAFPSEHVAAQKSGAYKSELISMHRFVSWCKEKGIYLIARMVVFKDPSLAEAFPDWMVHRPDGSLWRDLEGAAWADPFRQEVQEYNIALAKEVALLGFDEIQFDYLRFPSDGEVREIQYIRESTLESRCAMMREFCARLRHELDPYPVLLSADVFGLTVWVDPEFDMGIGQRIQDIAPYMDYISPMVYPSTFAPGNLDLERPNQQPYEVVYRACMALAQRTSTPIRPWLQHYWFESVPYGVKELRQQRQAAIDASTEGWMFWNAAGRYVEGTFNPAE